MVVALQADGIAGVPLNVIEGELAAAVVVLSTASALESARLPNAGASDV